MKAPDLRCPYASYTGGMKIRCSKPGSSMTMCGFQYYKRCKGWWALTEAAAHCKLRRMPEEELT